MGLRELMILLLILAIVGVILRGLYVALRARRGQLRMALEKNILPYDPDELLASELPNGGARLVQRSFEQVVKRNSEFTSRDQAIPVLMDTLGEDEPLDESPRASGVANARHAARQKHSQRTLKPVQRPIDRMAAAKPLAAGAAAASVAMAEEDLPRRSGLQALDDEPRDSFSDGLYRDDDDQPDEDYDDAEDNVDEGHRHRDDRAARDHDSDDDDWEEDDEQDDYDEQDDDDYDEQDDDDEQDDYGEQDDDYDEQDDDYDEQDEYEQDDYEQDDPYDEQNSDDDAEERPPESWEADRDGEDDEHDDWDVENEKDDRDSADDDDVLLRPRAGEGAQAESWYEEEAPVASPAQDTRGGPRRWWQWAGEKLSGMGAAAAEKAVQEPERGQRAEPVLGLDTFDDDHVSVPRTVVAPSRPVREPLDKSRQKELSLDHPEDEILRERARAAKPARRQRDAELLHEDAEPVPAQLEHSARAAAAAPDFSEVLVLNVVARPDREISGVEMLQVLLANQLRFGDMAIFHRHLGADAGSPVLFSVANLVNPGTFDLNRISEFSTRGLCFFMTLPSAASHSMQAFDQMLDAAQKVRMALDADLKDDNRSVMTAQTIEHYRQRVRDFDLRQLRQAK